MNLFYRKSETEELFITIVVATLERIGEEALRFYAVVKGVNY